MTPVVPTTVSTAANATSAATRAAPGAGRADRYAVIGHPVAHSQSPFIHARFAEQTGDALLYGRIDCPAPLFAETVRAFAASVIDGCGPARGCNITVPLKFAVLRLAARSSDRAVLAQAANVLTFDADADDADDGWQADNTDGLGLVRDLQYNAGCALAGQRLLLIGAGGAAAGALGPLIEAGPAEIRIVNRTADRADALADRHRALADQHGVVLHGAGLDAPGAAHDVVINATATSLQSLPSPVPATTLRPGTLALDMMYGPAAAPFLDWAAAHGAVPRDGLGMLVEQAAEAFRLWRGKRPRTDGVLAGLRSRVGSA